MKSKFRKIASLLLILILVISALAIAQGGNDSNIKNTASIVSENGVFISGISDTAETYILPENTGGGSSGGGSGGGYSGTSHGSESDKNNETEPNEGEEPYIPLPLSDGSHFAYVSGYGNGNFMPTSSIKRGETGAIFARLLNSGEKPEGYGSDFSDTTGHWANSSLGFIENYGIINGYPDGSFRPERSITRAEFATVVSRFVSVSDDTTTGAAVEIEPFTDTEGHWAQTSIEKCRKAGIISGYGNGRFMPDSPITRAEAVSIINRLTAREADKDFIDANLENIIRFTDVKPPYWAYYDIIEAANSHGYDYSEDSEEWKN